ncbi:hypothetical protein WICPIJ_003263, partial [Wickerhamomyces pijperi]
SYASISGWLWTMMNEISSSTNKSLYFFDNSEADAEGGGVGEDAGFKEESSPFCSSFLSSGLFLSSMISMTESFGK